MLIESFIPDALTSADELNMAQRMTLRLSMKDHWENNGILDYLATWSNSDQPSLLWIGGQSGNQDSWVSELALDIVIALGSQGLGDILAHVFFHCVEDRPLTALDFARLLIARTVEQRPTIVLEMPELLNTRVLRRANSFTQAWSILEAVIKRLGKAFFIIDRADAAAESEDGTSAIDDLLPRLLGAVEQNAGELKAIVTSTQAPPTVWANDPRLSSVWLNTGIASKKRERR
jgi:hypothetical protein